MRKNMIHLVGAAAVLVAGSPFILANNEHPNVLLIITDDQNDYMARASGVTVQTPNLDRLREQAITFSIAYCASPVCGP